jgi:hypothetical protein
MGVVALALGVVVLAAAWTLDLGLAPRVASALFFFMGFLGIFQARARTCVALAAQGVCNMGAGAEVVQDRAELEASRAEARRVLVRSAVATLAVTAVAILVG